MATDGNAVIAGENDVGIGHEAVRRIAVTVRVIEFREDTTELAVDPIDAGKVTSDFIADDSLVAEIQDTGDGSFVTDREVTVIEWMRQ